MNSIATYIVFGLSITLVCAGKSNDDPCKANPCANRGVCLPIFTCDCQDGYAGDTCNQVVASPCKPNPCKNGGVCKKNGGSYTCICAAGYEGSNCQTSTDPCSSSPCLNGGKCKTKGSAFTCSCADGYSGSNCNKFDPCYSSPCLNGGECSVQKGTFTCSCADGFSGKNCNVVDKLADCSDALKSGKKSEGVYPIKLSSGNTVAAYCEDGGWLRFLRRQDGSVDFNRGWADYTNGFGDPKGEYWLGNENVHQILSSGRSYALRIDITWWDGSSGYAEYSSFSLSSGLDFYRINVDGYSGTIGDVFVNPVNGKAAVVSGNAFTTFDSDHDLVGGGNCALAYPGGWWYNACWGIMLTGKYANDGTCPVTCPSDCVCHCSQVCRIFKMIKYTTMKFRPIGV